MKCPNCGEELSNDDYCDCCREFINLDFLINNGDTICLNCTYWSVSPYGSADGMYCRRGNGQTDPTDSCFDFVQSQSFASYGDGGQYQFDETSDDTSNKLYIWRNSR